MVATLSQVTAGLAGVVIADSTQSAVSTAEIGKRAVENNSMGMALGGYQVENTIVSSGSAFLTTAVGGFIGKKTENLLDTKYNPVANKYKFETIYVPYPIEIQRSKSIMPSIFGNAANNSGALGFQIYLKSKLEELKK